MFPNPMAALVRHLVQAYNFRDIGGPSTADGRTLKTGVLFRSDALTRIDDRDLAELRALNVKLICDLRSARESQRKPARVERDIQLVNVPLHERPAHEGMRHRVLGFLFSKDGDRQFREFSRRYYRHIAFDQTSRIRQVIALLANEGSLPAVIQCTAGKDRTGFLAALIQLLLGVPYRSVMEDYLRTNDYFAPRRERLIKVARFLTLFQVTPQRLRLLLMAHPEFLDQVHDEILATHGTIERYLCEACAIDRQTIETLKRRLLA